MRLVRWCLFLFFVSYFSCTDDDRSVNHQPPLLMELPKGFPTIGEPDDNLFTIERWELGKKLFFDPVLSVDSSISCASCHHPALAFSDDVAISPGVADRLGARNAPTLANVAFHPYYTREGGVPTLEMQVLVPIQEHDEFDFNIVLLADRLNRDASYVQMAEAAYNRRPGPFVVTRALACFERSLISGYSRYDQYASYDDRQALTTSEIRGMQLFFSDRTNCSQCHGGFNFTNYAFENNGLYEQYADPGRFRLTGDEIDRARFKVPTLRNIALTAPYMHDGSIAELGDIIDHYNHGGAAHPHKSSLIKPLNLSNEEKADLIAFLHTLTDEAFVKNPLFDK